MRARDCKIVATMGPASDPPERLTMLIEAGVDCFRLNFSHGGRDDHARRMQTIRAAEQKAGAAVGLQPGGQPETRQGAPAIHPAAHGLAWLYYACSIRSGEE